MANIKQHRELLNYVRGLIPPGYSADIVKYSGQCKHYRLTLSGAPGSRFMTLPGSPKNSRDQNNYARQWLRRTLQELGHGGT